MTRVRDVRGKRMLELNLLQDRGVGLKPGGLESGIDPSLKGLDHIATGGVGFELPKGMFKGSLFPHTVSGLVESYGVLKSVGIDPKYPERLLFILSELIGKDAPPDRMFNLLLNGASEYIGSRYETGESQGPGKAVSDFLNGVVDQLLLGRITAGGNPSMEALLSDRSLMMVVRSALWLANNWIGKIVNHYLLSHSGGPAQVHMFPDTVPESAHPLLKKGITTEEIIDHLREKFQTLARSSYMELNPETLEAMPNRLRQGLRSMDRFFGYESVKEGLGNHFEMFSKGKRVSPLYIVGPSGVGKTQLVMAFAKERGAEVFIADERVLGKILDVATHLGKDGGKKVIIIENSRTDQPVNIPPRGFPRNVMVVITSQNEPSSYGSGKVIKFQNAFKDLHKGDGLRIALGLIGEFVGGLSSPNTRIVQFILQDFFNGAYPLELESVWKGGRPHGHPITPKGLVEYLSRLHLSGRLDVIKKRMEDYDRLAENRNRLLEVIKELSEKGVF